MANDPNIFLLTILCNTQYCAFMSQDPAIHALQEKLGLELRRGALVLAALSQLDSDQYGYSLLERLAESGIEIEQGTLYPMLRRLDEQGLLESRWDVDGPRPRKYYRLSRAGTEVLQALAEEWRELVAVMEGLLDGSPGG